jgi:hypothetical protein
MSILPSTEKAHNTAVSLTDSRRPHAPTSLSHAYSSQALHSRPNSSGVGGSAGGTTSSGDRGGASIGASSGDMEAARVGT